jgi:glycosyltransferase involved in cell wall biosynthesis
VAAVDVVLPVLNEVEALPWILDRMPQEYRPIVVDNGSTDGSGALARSEGALVVEESRPGFGSACFAGLVASTAPVVAFMDADASLDPRDLWRVVDPVIARRADLVLGARVPDAGAWPLSARVSNHVVCRALRHRTGVRLHDLGPMRSGRRDALMGLGIQDRRFGWPLEMVMRAVAEGWQIEEVNVRYQARIGKSKVTGTVKGTLRTVKDMSELLR